MQVIKPLGETSYTISGINALRSASLEGVPQIVLAFALSKDGNVTGRRWRVRDSRRG